MNQNLFKLALDRLQQSDWESFEELSSSFLVLEFPQLRTMASPSGDGGRDSELFQAEGKPFIAFQYSIQQDWKRKIRYTAKRIMKEFPNIKVLIYLTNQQIGGRADELKRELSDIGLTLDVRDKNWFIERAIIGDEREVAAERLIDRIARPYLIDEKIIHKKSSPLSSNEARAALLYLGLQLQDDTTDKGLTKLAYDALVRSVLRHTHSLDRLSRNKIYEGIFELMPSGNREILKNKIDSALKRLTKRFIRHWSKEDEFCLTHEEHQRILSRLAEVENEESLFDQEIFSICDKCLKEMDYKGNNIDDLVQRVPRIIERILLSKGEAFVSGVVSGEIDKISFENIYDIIIYDLSKYPPSTRDIDILPKMMSEMVQNILSNSNEHINRYLNRLSNSYTLFSFLRETPDVQSATNKLFSHGAIWLDTTVLLPAFAEQLEEDESKRKYQKLFLACHEIGIDIYVTQGIINELTSHMKIALTCSQSYQGAWVGRIPYIYDSYLQTGRIASEFYKWLLLFKGNERPEDDIKQFIFEVFKIKTQDLTDDGIILKDEIRWMIEECWKTEHYRRRKDKQSADDIITNQLIKHDIETYLGVIALRQKEDVTELGYKHWLLTFDKTAWYIRNKVREEYKMNTPPSPLISMDYLMSNISFGPKRNKLSKYEKDALPIILDVEMSESMPHDIIKISNEVRKENEGIPEYVIRRKVRDAIDHSRRQRWCSDKDNS